MNYLKNYNLFQVKQLAKNKFADKGEAQMTNGMDKQ